MTVQCCNVKYTLMKQRLSSYSIVFFSSVYLRDIILYVSLTVRIVFGILITIVLTTACYKTKEWPRISQNHDDSTPPSTREVTSNQETSMTKPALHEFHEQLVCKDAQLGPDNAPPSHDAADSPSLTNQPPSTVLAASQPHKNTVC